MANHAHRYHPSPARWALPSIFALVSIALLFIGIVARGAPADAAGGTGVGLGTASTFAVLAGSTVTNTGPSVISGDVGLSPGSSITGFPPGQVLAGTKHIADGVAVQAQSDLTTAYNQAAGAPSSMDVTGQDLGGKTLIPGVYEASSGMALTGNLTLNAQGDPAAVFIFKAGTTLVTAPNSSVRFINGGSACNVYWQVGSSATLDSTTNFIGTILAHTSATLNTGATVQGRVLARAGAVTLDSNVITRPDCSTSTPTATPTPTSTSTSTASSAGSPPASSTPSSPKTTPSTTAAAPGNPTTPLPPRIPKRFPHTGLGGTQGTSSGGILFIGSALSGAAALASVGMGYRRERTTRRRS
ncbi:MAG: hypothetical protein NVS3B1_01880 [Marmoricola sp.]